MALHHRFDRLVTEVQVLLLLVLTTAAFIPLLVEPSYQQRHAMQKLPDTMVKYNTVPNAPKTFTATSIPRGLLKDHSTKEGTWGVIRVIKGTIGYKIVDESFHILDPSTPGIIEPQVLHSVVPSGEDVEFVVEFYRLPETGPIDEPREGL